MFLKLAYLPSKHRFSGKYLFQQNEIFAEQLPADSSSTETLYCLNRVQVWRALKLRGEAHPFERMGPMLLGAESKLVHTRRILVHFFLIVETVCKGNTHDAAIRNGVKFDTTEFFASFCLVPVNK